jgi:2,3-diketo-5-methylthio-1-phosphopentane phosphatase
VISDFKRVSAQPGTGNRERATDNGELLKVFIDFDGTITKEDIGANIFIEFGDKERAYEFIYGFRDGKYTAAETWEGLLETISNPDEDKIRNFVNGFEIDEYFLDFLSFLNENGVPFYVVSDGFRFYIESIFQKEGIVAPFYSNELEFSDEGLRMIFPYTDENCNRCANCKRNHVVSLSGDNEFSIYIGNGNSDICAALHCDYIFAKDMLLKYCEKNRVSYYPFKSFRDVKARITELLGKKKLKKRHQAELNRRKLYMQG